MKSVQMERTYKSLMNVLLFGVNTRVMTWIIEVVMKPEIGLLTRKKKVFNFIETLYRIHKCFEEESMKGNTKYLEID